MWRNHIEKLYNKLHQFTHRSSEDVECSLWNNVKALIEKFDKEEGDDWRKVYE